mmetsp:Transcript_25195/g.45503  ORF Transcript_25195/g.45503 Transcript_25195/m.45503 type:complete len:232 (-) Transcript_25195:1161-1856(-)
MTLVFSSLKSCIICNGFTPVLGNKTHTLCSPQSASRSFPIESFACFSSGKNTTTRGRLISVVWVPAATASSYSFSSFRSMRVKESRPVPFGATTLSCFKPGSRHTSRSSSEEVARFVASTIDSSIISIDFASSGANLVAVAIKLFPWGKMRDLTARSPRLLVMLAPTKKVKRAFPRFSVSSSKSSARSSSIVSSKAKSASSYTMTRSFDGSTSLSAISLLRYFGVVTATSV